MMFYKETNFKQEPPIGNVPKEWEVVRLKDVADYINGYPFSPKDWKDKGLPIIRIQNLNDPNAEFNYFEGDIEDKYIVENGDLLFSWSASIGAYIWNRGKAVLNQHIFKVVPNDNIDKLYLFYALFLAIEQLKQKVHGSTMKHFKKTELQTKIPLPPLPEQKEIAKVLGVVDSLIAKTGEVIVKTERLKKGLMQTLLTRGIGHKEFKDTEIGRIPKDWEVVKIVDACAKVKAGGTPLTSKKEYYNGDIPFVKIEDLANAQKYLKNTLITITKAGLENSSAWLVPPKSILLAMYGSIGAMAINEIPVATNQAILGIVPKEEKTDVEFIYYLLNFLTPHFARHAKQTTQANLTAEIVREFKIPIPPILEQRKIAEILSTVDKKLEFEKNEKAKLERIKLGLMDLLLTGKIRIKVN
jgi:type I restriction enzyme S subunit